MTWLSQIPAWLLACALVLGTGVQLVDGGDSPPQSADGEWPQWRGPRGTGISAERGWLADFPETDPPISWESNVGIGYAAVSVSGGKLYTVGWNDGQDTLYCLDAVSGDQIWTFAYPAKVFDNMHSGGPAATPAVSDNRVYTLSRDGGLFCLDITDGELIWSHQLPDKFNLDVPDYGFAGSPIVDGERLYVDVGRIIALDKSNGEVIWQTFSYIPAYSTPMPFTLDGEQLLAVFPAYGLVLLNASTGRELAKRRWTTHYKVNAATPIVHGNHIFISSGFSSGAALLQYSKRELDLVWDNEQMSTQTATCVLIDGFLYGFDEARFKCLEFNSGRRQWSEGGLGKGSLMAADDKLIVLSEEGELVIADVSPIEFRVRTRAKVLDTDRCWTVPVLAGGRIYCRSRQGQLVCVDLRN